jgi:hypothetical protein
MPPHWRSPLLRERSSVLQNTRRACSGEMGTEMPINRLLANSKVGPEEMDRLKGLHLRLALIESG